MRGPEILGVMDVKHADRDNLRTLTAMIHVLDCSIPQRNKPLCRLPLRAAPDRRYLYARSSWDGVSARRTELGFLHVQAALANARLCLSDVGGEFVS